MSIQVSKVDSAELINSFVVAVVMLNSGFVGCQYIDSIMIHSYHDTQLS